MSTTVCVCEYPDTMTMEDARIDTCRLGMVPCEGKLSGTEVDILCGIYTDIDNQDKILDYTEVG